MSEILEVLRQLDDWRHLPAYQLERRVDIFFGMFLPAVIEKEFCVDVDEVIPEFPLHKALLVDQQSPQFESSSHHSVNVDFAVFGHKGESRRLFLVELKTDMESLNCKQLENMKKARCAGPKHLIRGVKEAACHSRSKHKYEHLIRRLLELNYLQFDDNRESTKSLRETLIP